MRKATALLAAATLGAASLAALGATAPATAAASGPLSFHGVSVVSALPTAQATTTWSPTHEFAAESESGRSGASGGPKPPSVPKPRTVPVSSSTSGLVTSFEGLNHFDHRTANGGNQFSAEPPDQGLCVGSGHVVESVNTVLRVYSTSGAAVSDVVDLNSFFGLPAEIDRATGVAGPFLSDPKCYFDTDTGRFFLTVLEMDAAPSTSTYTLVAASQTADPTGAWNIFWLNTTNDGTGGTPTHVDCPCLGDQPLIGADKYGFYITTNEFSVNGPGFNGAQVYAMSKRALEKGATPPVAYFDNLPLAEGPAYSLQPATSPTAGDYSTRNNGTEYMLSALDFNATTDNRIALWSLTNTRSLDTAKPSVTLTSTVLRSQAYGQPPVADQKDGDHPFGTWGAEYFYGGAPDQPINTLNSNDDRMQQAVFARGSLWAGLTTAVDQGKGVQKAGVAWFRVKPEAEAGSKGVKLKGEIAAQGYVSIAGNNVIFPSIGVTPKGRAVLAVTLSGADYYPSAAYSVLSDSAFRSLRIAGAGVGPADGYTGYDPFVDDGVERWGDYSAAVSTPSGTVWVANEYIAQSCTVAEYQADTSCGHTRTTLANWSTRVSAIRP